MEKQRPGADRRSAVLCGRRCFGGVVSADVCFLLLRRIRDIHHADIRAHGPDAPEQKEAHIG